MFPEPSLAPVSEAQPLAPAAVARAALSSLSKWLGCATSQAQPLAILVAEMTLVALSLLGNLSYFSGVLGASWAARTAPVVLPFILLCRGVGFLAFDTWQRSLRFAEVADLVAIGKSIGSSSVAAFVLYQIARGWLHAPIYLPGAFFVGDALSLFLLLVALHFSVRVYNGRDNVRIAADAKRVVVIGAGDAGASVARDLIANPQAGVWPVAFVDDDPNKRGTRICGVPVKGDTRRLSEVVRKSCASEVLFCIPSCTGVQMRRVLASCLQCGVPVRALPGVSELLNSRASWRDLRSVKIEDLLHRERFVPDSASTRDLVGGKVVLVTGAGGSIGSELCRQVAAGGPKHLILLDKSENSLFYSHMGIEETHPAVKTTPILADIVDQELVSSILQRHRPELVFHAAAFKHVGMMELHPEQAIRNNLLGTRNVLMAAVEAGAEAVVNVSTDKAVAPRNYMGASKKLAEMVAHALATHSGARVMNVRFGNVAGSTGSVVRIFSENITKGKPLRITDPRATRYFMSIPEAVYLILCAAALGKGGETFVLDMGDPVNIYELARTLSLLSGVTLGDELPIHFTGLREGEKIREELWEPWEDPRPTENPHLSSILSTAPQIDILGAARRCEELIADRRQSELLEYIDEIMPSFADNHSPLAHSVSHDSYFETQSHARMCS